MREGERESVRERERERERERDRDRQTDRERERERERERQRERAQGQAYKALHSRLFSLIQCVWYAFAGVYSCTFSQNSLKAHCGNIHPGLVDRHRRVTLSS